MIIKNQKLLRLVKIFGVIFILLGVLEIWAVNRLSTFGKELESLYTKKSQLILENQILEAKISEKSSLWVIGPQTKILGFESPRSIKVISLKMLEKVGQ